MEGDLSALIGSIGSHNGSHLEGTQNRVGQVGQDTLMREPANFRRMSISATRLDTPSVTTLIPSVSEFQPPIPQVMNFPQQVARPAPRARVCPEKFHCDCFGFNCGWKQNGCFFYPCTP